MNRTRNVLRRKLLEKYDFCCALCGVSNETTYLETAHITPISSGGENEEDNLVVLCPNCHRAIDSQPLEREFVVFLAHLLRNAPGYEDVREEAVLGKEVRYRADILATRAAGGRGAKLLIECKSSRFASFDRIKDVISQLNRYKTVRGEYQPVLAIPATLQEREVRMLQDEGIELWDLDFLAATFRDQLNAAPAGYFRNLLLARADRGKKTTQQRKLLDALKSCKSGRQDWSVYQSLVGDILELLFCPPLTQPMPEHSDGPMANRRDFILPNYAEEGFWAFLRGRYMADYVVVDAKNYSRKIKKPDVLQVANYLKPHGAGLLGMIISRHGGDTAGCAHTLREQWLIHQKMILVFDDEDLELMLRASEDGRNPEELVGKKIEQFRLSM